MTAVFCRQNNVARASGSLLVAVKPASAEKIVRTLGESKIHAEIIGQFLPSPRERFIMRGNGKIDILARPVTDELWQALEHSLDP